MFSFTDCTSVATCRVNGISNIATFDDDIIVIVEDHGLNFDEAWVRV